MPILLTDKGGGDIAPVPAGIHQAICYLVVDCGTQASSNPAYKPKQKLILGFEFPHERADFGEKKNQPRSLSRTYGASLNEKSTLRATLESWRGRPFTEEELRGFDPKNLIGANCQVNVVQENKAGKLYANIGAIVPLGKGQPKLALENKPLYFSLSDQPDLTNIKYPDNMPEWIKGRIAFSEEVVAATTGSGHPEPGADTGGEDDSGSVPF